MIGAASSQPTIPTFIRSIRENWEKTLRGSDGRKWPPSQTVVWLRLVQYLHRDLRRLIYRSRRIRKVVVPVLLLLRSWFWPLRLSTLLPHLVKLFLLIVVEIVFYF